MKIRQAKWIHSYKLLPMGLRFRAVFYGSGCLSTSNRGGYRIVPGGWEDKLVDQIGRNAKKISPSAPRLAWVPTRKSKPILRSGAPL